MGAVPMGWQVGTAAIRLDLEGREGGLAPELLLGPCGSRRRKSEGTQRRAETGLAKGRSRSDPGFTLGRDLYAPPLTLLARAI